MLSVAPLFSPLFCCFYYVFLCFLWSVLLSFATFPLYCVYFHYNLVITPSKEIFRIHLVKLWPHSERIHNPRYQSWISSSIPPSREASVWETVWPEIKKNGNKIKARTKSFQMETKLAKLYRNKKKKILVQASFFLSEVYPQNNTYVSK